MSTTGTCSRRISGFAAGAALLAFSTTGWAQLSDYSQDFESLDAMDANALADEGWVVGANVFAPDGTTFLYDYFAFPAPNGGPAFSAIASGEGGVDQGAQQLSIYSDYNNMDHNIGARIEAIVFQEQTITADDVGKTLVFSFDAKMGNIELASTAKAFIKTLDPNAGFFTTKVDEVDTTALGTEWVSFSLSIAIDGSQVGQILQFGFSNTASNFEGSGVFYDNISYGTDPSTLLVPFSQDSEALDIESETALSELGWIVGANVFAPDGTTFLYNYFAFPAPNGGPAFSAVVAGEGGATQGAQQMSVYNDYNNADHSIGARIEANVFQEKVVVGANVGETWTFSFDAKRGNIEGASTALAFIKTLDPSTGFSTTNFITVDMTDLPTTWDRYEISLTIDESLPGQLLQFGFLNVASNFEGSGIFYDNILFSTPVDSDGDGVFDAVDNCLNDANPLQVDSNGDNIGNVCDADIAGLSGPGFDDCTVNFFDLGRMKAVFFSSDPDADLVGMNNSEPDGTVNFFDLGRMKALFFAPPGPSAAGCN